MCIYIHTRAWMPPQPSVIFLALLCVPIMPMDPILIPAYSAGFHRVTDATSPSKPDI